MKLLHASMSNHEARTKITRRVSVCLWFLDRKSLDYVCLRKDLARTRTRLLQDETSRSTVSGRGCSCNSDGGVEGG